MTAAEQFTDPYLAVYRRVPPLGVGICTVCRRGVPPDARLCYSCEVTTRQVAFPALAMLPISLYEVPDQLWNILRYYKDSPRPEVRMQWGTVVAATLGRFCASHWPCITDLVGGEPSVVTTVPSTSGRAGVHPLVAAVRRVALLRPRHNDLLTPGNGRVGRLRATDGGFACPDDLSGERVLLIEDTFTSGARTQSAASALRRGGAASVGVLAIGRVLERSHCRDCDRVWRYATARRFRFDVCGRCTGDGGPPV